MHGPTFRVCPWPRTVSPNAEERCRTHQSRTRSQVFCDCPPSADIAHMRGFVLTLLTAASFHIVIARPAHGETNHTRILRNSSSRRRLLTATAEQTTAANEWWCNHAEQHNSLRCKRHKLQLRQTLAVDRQGLLTTNRAYISYERPLIASVVTDDTPPTPLDSKPATLAIRGRSYEM